MADDKKGGPRELKGSQHKGSREIRDGGREIAKDSQLNKVTDWVKPEKPPPKKK